MKRLYYFLIGAILGLTAMSPANDVPVSNRRSLTVNGHVFTNETLSLYDRGVLALVEENPVSSKYKPVPFRVTLQRAGTPIQQWPINGRATMYSVQLDEFWSSARMGDELVIETVNMPGRQPVRRPEKRVISVRFINYIVNWLSPGKC